MNPSQGTVAAIGIEVRVDRALVLPGRVWCAERPRAIVAIVHGLGEHGGRYAALASELATRARCTVVALDLPGHGEAPGPRGDIPSWTAVRDQVIPAMFTATRGLPDQPFELTPVLLGHSMGGVLALDYALAHPRSLRALILSAPALRTKMPPWWKLALANVARATSPATGFPNGLDRSGLSRDPEVRELYDRDPQVHDRISPRLYFAFEEARQRCLREARRLQLPTLLLQGMADRVVDPKGALEFSGAAAHGVVRFVTLADAYHEVFNDTGREPVIRDLIAWLDAALVV
ncbi:MAG TPA: lysophospholipase [Candidatus Acidoferrales bacterium]|nr:lysophospholipase [Candidatus Acidoferrales bacterium]